MIVLYFVLFVLGVAGLTTASVLQLLHYPTDRIDWGSRRLRPVRLGHVFLIMVLFGIFGVQNRLGWWPAVLMFVLSLLAREVPRRLHNREVDRRDVGAERACTSAAVPRAL